MDENEITPALAPPVEGEPSSHETCGADPAGQVAETFPGGGTDPQAAPDQPEPEAKR